MNSKVYRLKMQIALLVEKYTLVEVLDRLTELIYEELDLLPTAPDKDGETNPTILMRLHNEIHEFAGLLEQLTEKAGMVAKLQEEWELQPSFCSSVASQSMKCQPD